MNTSRDWYLLPPLGGIALVIVLGGLFQMVAAATTQAACGVGAEPVNVFSGVAFLFTGSPSHYVVVGDCAFPTTVTHVLDIVAALLLVTIAVAGTVAYVRYRQSDTWFINDIKSRPGFAKGGEVAKNLSSKAVLKRAKVLRPTLMNPQATDVGWKLGKSVGQDVYVSIEDSVVVEGAPRSGKGYRILISAILDWSGPLITTSTTNDNLTATLAMRKQRGQVTVFDPQGLSGVSSALRISPIVGCEDPLVADQRGQAIIAGTALGASSTNQEWAGVASTVLSRLLHAAAVSGGDVADLYQWGSNPGLARAAVDILRRDGAPGWSDDLDAVISGDEKLLASSWFGVSAAVRPLSIPSMREALSPRPGEHFDPNEFLSGQNTLYMIGSGSGAGSIGGFLGALLDDIVETARRKALATPGSRLDLPLGLILDEIANMFSWPALPRTMADGGGRGICTLVVLQALSQAVTAWSKAEADTIWSAATAKVLLGGASDVGHLRDVEALLGTRSLRRTSRSYSDTGSSTSLQEDRVPVMTIDEIRRMPASMGFLAYRNLRGVLLDLRGWTERADARTINSGKRDAELSQQAVFAEQYARRTTPAPESPEEAPVEATSEPDEL